jgi:hypothetical protein
MSITPEGPLPSAPDPSAAPPLEPPPPWPVSMVDRSPAAVRRRGLALFHVVALVMAGGLWALVPGPWVIAAGLVWLVTVSYSARRHVPAMVGSLTRMESELTRLYAQIEEANRPERESGTDESR